LIAPFDIFYHQEVNLTYHYQTGVPEIKLYFGHILCLITGVLTVRVHFVESKKYFLGFSKINYLLIRGFPVVASTFIYSDINSLKFGFRSLILYTKSTNIGIPRLIMNSQYTFSENDVYLRFYMLIYYSSLVLSHLDKIDQRLTFCVGL
jgi:hypothetical protein